jgi:hypothetical protein
VARAALPFLEPGPARDLGVSWPVVMNAFRTCAVAVTDQPLPAVEVLGIDEIRRGRPRWEQDPASGKWKLARDRWHTGFVEAATPATANGARPCSPMSTRWR